VEVEGIKGGGFQGTRQQAAPIQAEEFPQREGHSQAGLAGELTVGEQKGREIGTLGEDKPAACEQAEIRFETVQECFGIFAVGGLEGAVQLLASMAEAEAEGTGVTITFDPGPGVFRGAP
jgi:hypothetical protein